MSRTFTRSEIHTKARRLANLRSTSFPTDAEVNDLINTHYAGVFDLLVQAGPPEYYASSNTVSVTANTISYALSGFASDFRTLLAVYENESTYTRRPIPAITRTDRAAYTAPSSSYTVTVEYIPAPATINTASGGDATTIDGVSGWEDLIVAYVARDLLLMEGSPMPPSLEGKISGLEKRVRTCATNRDLGQPRRIVDVTQQNSYTYPYSTGIRGYRLVGANIEFYECVVYP